MAVLFRDPALETGLHFVFTKRGTAVARNDIQDATGIGQPPNQSFQFMIGPGGSKPGTVASTTQSVNLFETHNLLVPHKCNLQPLGDQNGWASFGLGHYLSQHSKNKPAYRVKYKQIYGIAQWINTD